MYIQVFDLKEILKTFYMYDIMCYENYTIFLEK